LSGTVRNAPPQLVAPPGKTSAKSQPVDASPPPDSSLPAMFPSIHPGHTKVAKVPSTNDLPPFQSHAASAADCPPSVASPSISKRFFSSVLPSTFSSPSEV